MPVSLYIFPFKEETFLFVIAFSRRSRVLCESFYRTFSRQEDDEKTSKKETKSLTLAGLKRKCSRFHAFVECFVKLYVGAP